MINYLHCEAYRLLHKRSIYLYFSILLLAYIGFCLVRVVGINMSFMLIDSESLFILLPTFVGGCLFVVLYTDDLSSRNLSTLVGYGLNKFKITIVKLILLIISSTIVYCCVVLLTYLIYALLGWPASIESTLMVAAWALKYLLTSIAYAAIASIFVYGFQHKTVAIVFYFLLALGVISSLFQSVFALEFVRSLLPSIETHLITGITFRIFSGLTISGYSILVPLVEYVIYIIVATSISVVAFINKEMEF